MMKLWTDRKGKVHAKGSGDLLTQMQELDSVITYCKRLAASMQVKAARIAGTDPDILMANEELRKQLAAQARTISLYDEDMKKRAANRGPKDPKVTLASDKKSA